jgi:hypothetical protein
MWEPRRLTTLWASTACYRDSFTLPLLFHEDVWGIGGIAPSFLTSALDGTVMSFTPWPLYSQGKSPCYPLDRSLVGPRSRSGRCEKSENVAHAGNWTPALRPSLQRLSCLDSHALTNLYETWHVYHGTWCHLRGVLHKSLPSLRVSPCRF